VEEIYIYDGLREERGQAGDHILLRFDESEDLTDRFLYGPNVDQVLAQEDVDSLLLNGETLWALTDHQGSVRDIATYDVIADTTTVENHVVYDAFGQITAESDPSVVLLVAFTGRERDLESDLQYNRFRYYDAAIGRWMSQDPIGFAAGDGNLVRYVASNPVSNRDPSGLQESSLNGWTIKEKGEKITWETPHPYTKKKSYIGPRTIKHTRYVEVSYFALERVKEPRLRLRDCLQIA